MFEKISYIDILASQPRGTLYIGVKMIAGFTCKYGVDKLVYFEEFPDIRLTRVRSFTNNNSTS